jgi:hypothetical protein
MRSKGLRRGSAADRLLGLQVRIPPVACLSVCLLCLLYSKDKRQQFEKSGQKRTNEVQGETKQKQRGEGEFFRTRPHRPLGPSSLL